MQKCLPTKGKHVHVQKTQTVKRNRGDVIRMEKYQRITMTHQKMELQNCNGSIKSVVECPSERIKPQCDTMLSKQSALT